MTGNGLSGKVVVVTGATSGIGRSVAVALGAGGAKVVAGGRRRAEGEALVEEIVGAGGEAWFVATDVAIEAEVARLVETAIELHGRLDCAFNNAGLEHGGALTDLTEADYRRVFDVNFWGVAVAMKREIAAMLATGGGSIVNTSSVAGHVGIAGFGLYSASKHAVEGLTKAAALDYARQGVRVNAVAPAFIDTPMAERFIDGSSDRRAAVAALHPAGRMGKQAEVVSAVLYLLSDAAGFVTGTSLAVDGGWLAR